MHQPCTEGGLTDEDVLHLFNFNTATYLDSYFSRGRLYFTKESEFTGTVYLEISRRELMNSNHLVYSRQSLRRSSFVEQVWLDSCPRNIFFPAKAVCLD